MIDNRSYTFINLSSYEIEAWKKFRTERDSNLWPRWYWCSNLPTELSSYLGAGHYRNIPVDGEGMICSLAFSLSKGLVTCNITSSLNFFQALIFQLLELVQNQWTGLFGAFRWQWRPCRLFTPLLKTVTWHWRDRLRSLWWTKLNLSQASNDAYLPGLWRSSLESDQGRPGYFWDSFSLDSKNVCMIVT